MQGGMFQRASSSCPSPLPACPHPHTGTLTERCPFPQPSRVFSDPGLQGTEIDIFSYKPTLLTSKTLEKIRPVLDYRCMVSGSEQKFLIGLGVSLLLASHLAVGVMEPWSRSVGVWTAACHTWCVFS